MSEMSETLRGRENSRSEEDLLRRSIKKPKSSKDSVTRELKTSRREEMEVLDSDSLEKENRLGLELPMEETVVPETAKVNDSYRDKLLGINGGILEDSSEEECGDSDSDLEDEEDAILEGSHEDIYCPRNLMTAEEVREWRRLWKTSLIVKLLGRKVSLKFLKDRLEKMWKPKGRMSVLDLEDDYFIVQFSQLDDYLYALHEGPWLVADHYLVIQRWRPEFDPSEDAFNKVAVWVRVPKLSVEYVNPKCIWRLGNVIGKTLKIDVNTLNTNNGLARVERGRFARICVEIDLRKKLRSKVRCGRRIYGVEYEGLGMICFGCGRYGHRKEACGENIVREKDLNDDGAVGMQKEDGREQVKRDENSVRKVQVGTENFGPWMLVQRNNRRRGVQMRKQGNIQGGNIVDEAVKNGGSRFDILAEEVEGGVDGMMVDDVGQNVMEEAVNEVEKEFVVVANNKGKEVVASKGRVPLVDLSENKMMANVGTGPRVGREFMRRNDKKNREDGCAVGMGSYYERRFSGGRGVVARGRGLQYDRGRGKVSLQDGGKAAMTREDEISSFEEEDVMKMDVDFVDKGSGSHIHHCRPPDVFSINEELARIEDGDGLSAVMLSGFEGAAGSVKALR